MITVGGIYYTDNRIDSWDIVNVCRNQLRKVFDENNVISVSLKPIDFGKNIVLEGMERSYPTMLTQILTALEKSTADFIYFLEHDVLYHSSHFDMVNHIDKEDVYYYNVNNWRWRWNTSVAINYNYLTSLSMMGCYRTTALNHYEARIKKMKEKELDKQGGREPKWGRAWGYEPGTKKTRRGGFTNEDHVRWYSEFPNIDIRHGKTFSSPKTFLTDFKHAPTDNSWKEKNVYSIPGWDLKGLFNYEFS